MLQGATPFERVGVAVADRAVGQVGEPAPDHAGICWLQAAAQVPPRNRLSPFASRAGRIRRRSRSSAAPWLSRSLTSVTRG